MRIVRRLGLSIAVVLCAVALAPASASAITTVSMSGTTLVAQGGLEVNDITIGVTLPSISDPGGIVAGAGCEQTGPDSAVCGDYRWDVLEAHLGDGADRVTGGALSPRRAVVYGEGGDDQLVVGESNDQLYGGDGNDSLSAGGGDDTIQGGPGDDTIQAGGGNDTIDAGPGRDNISADGYIAWEDGNDTLLVRDGEQDSAQCGLGADTAVADRIDVITECELVDLPPLAPPTPAPDTTAPQVKLPDRKLTLDKGGYVRVRVTCPAGEPAGCKGTVTLRSAKKVKATRGSRAAILTMGSKTYTAKAATTVTVKVKLSTKARTVVRRAKRLKVRLSVTARDQANNGATGARTLTLRRR